MKNKGEIIVYQSKDGKTSVEVALKENTLWLSLNQIAKLFGRDKSVVSRHLNKIFSSGELEKKATVAKNATVQTEGKRAVERQIDFYNLDAIISVGYRVNSLRGTQFRIWATNVLKQHLVEGYSVNARRLKKLKQTIKLVGNVVKNTRIYCIFSLKIILLSMGISIHICELSAINVFSRGIAVADLGEVGR
jgi:hypothetical protein